MFSTNLGESINVTGMWYAFAGIFPDLDRDHARVLAAGGEYLGSKQLNGFCTGDWMCVIAPDQYFPIFQVFVKCYTNTMVKIM